MLNEFSRYAATGENGREGEVVFAYTPWHNLSVEGCYKLVNVLGLREVPMLKNNQWCEGWSNTQQKLVQMYFPMFCHD
jgi:hypothetical protein